MKKLFVGMFAVTVITFAIYGVTKTNNSKAGLSALTMQNIEALAQVEGPISDDDYTSATGCRAVWEDFDCRGKDGYIYTYSVRAK